MPDHGPRHTGHPIATISFAEGLVVCRCGWRSVRGLGCEELAAAYRDHRRAIGARTMSLGDAAGTHEWRVA